MAKKRMFSLNVLETDAFMDLPLSAQALYFHLCMRADDDGFIGNPKRITQNIGASIDDLKLLITKRFVLVFEDGVIVIKHWRMHNVIKSDRYIKTNFIEDFAQLQIKENGAYTTLKELPGTQTERNWNPNGTQMAQTRPLDKNSIDKNSISIGNNILKSEKRFSPPSIQEVDEYCRSRNNGIDAEKFIDYYQQQGWKLSNGNPMKDWKAAVRTWEHRNPKKISHELDGYF